MEFGENFMHVYQRKTTPRNVCSAHNGWTWKPHLQCAVPHSDEEEWLACLNNVHEDFLSTGNSAVDVPKSVLVSRPYGGTAIFVL